jgi:hypothetical protein
VVRDPKRFDLVRKSWDLMLTGNHTPAEIREIANTAWGFRTQRGNPLPFGLSIKAGDLALENSSDLNQVQRITFGYNISFSNDNDFTSEDVLITLNASIAGLSCFSTLDLTTRQHPYMIAGPISWLSADTRVFSRQPNGTFANATLVIGRPHGQRRGRLI